jgi:hypothetical protein
MFAAVNPESKGQLLSKI